MIFNFEIDEEIEAAFENFIEEVCRMRPQLKLSHLVLLKMRSEELKFQTLDFICSNPK